MDDKPDWELAAEFFDLSEKLYRETIQWVVERSGLAEGDITGRKRTEPIAGWRAVAMSRCAAGGMSQIEIGAFFGKDRSSVSNAMIRVKAMAETVRAVNGRTPSPGENKSR